LGVNRNNWKIKGVEVALLRPKEDLKSMNIEALKLYGRNDGFCRAVNESCQEIEKHKPEIYETEEELFQIALERTYDDYLESLEQERKYFKRYKVSVEVQIDRQLDPKKFFEIVFSDSNGIQHSLREVLEVEEIAF
jgi:hypothetical protein